jgi:hypothetical protein
LSAVYFGSFSKNEDDIMIISDENPELRFGGFGGKRQNERSQEQQNLKYT